MRSGNLLQEIWLNKERVQEAYIKTGRQGVKEKNAELLKILESQTFQQSWLEQYRKDMIAYIQTKNRESALFPYEFAKDIQKVLQVIDKRQENLKRVLSLKCFGDSKYFEKNIEHYIVRMIKRYLLDSDNLEEYTDNDILLEVGISKYPEVLEFCGDLQFVIAGKKMVYHRETLGSYINSNTVKKMDRLKIKHANKVLFIENKANYIDYIQNKQEDDELVVYHGGMYSPTKGAFFQKIYEAGRRAAFYHWSDIDIGGFKIFARLREIIPGLQPYLMNKEAFMEKQFYWKAMTQEYKKKLSLLQQDKKYEIFHELIEEMLKQESKLEQEAFIVD